MRIFSYVNLKVRTLDIWIMIIDFEEYQSRFIFSINACTDLLIYCQEIFDKLSISIEAQRRKRKKKKQQNYFVPNHNHRVFAYENHREDQQTHIDTLIVFKKDKGLIEPNLYTKTNKQIIKEVRAKERRRRKIRRQIQR